MGKIVVETTAIIVRTLSTSGGTERFVWGLCHWMKKREIPFVLYCQIIEHPIAGIDIVQWPKRLRGRILNVGT